MDAELIEVEEHEHEHVVPATVYYIVFGALMALTAATVAVAYVDLGRFNIAVALGVAIVKATLVVLFFMHVKYSSRLVQLVLLASVVWLIILFGITLSDYITRGWLVTPPIVR